MGQIEHGRRRRRGDLASLPGAWWAVVGILFVLIMAATGAVYGTDVRGGPAKGEVERGRCERPSNATTLSGDGQRPGAAETEPGLVAVEPTTATVRSGRTFTVAVVISDAVDAAGFEFTLAYDPTVVHVEDAGLGGFLGSTGRSVIALDPDIDNATGSMAFAAYGLGEEPGPDGAGALAEIGLTAQAAGRTRLDLEDVLVGTTAGEDQAVTVIDGTAVVLGVKGYLPLVLRR